MAEPRGEMDDDRPLVERAQAGEYAAFEQLVEKYEDRVYSLAMRILRRADEAQDVVQQTFLSVMEHLRSFRHEAKFATWLARVATNHALGIWRTRNRQRMVSLSGPEDEAEGELPHPQFIARWRESPDQIAARREIRAILDEELDALDEKYRLVFLLRDVEGLSTSETAETLGLTESNVKVRLLRARLMLRERLTRRFGDQTTQLIPGHHH